MHPGRSLPRSWLSRSLPAALFAATVIGCTDDPVNGPDDASLDAVLALFGDRCAGAACHAGSGTEPAAGLDLGPDTACDHLVEIPAIEAPALRRVVPGSPEQSYLLCKLTPDCMDLPDRATIMPPTLQGGLPAAERDLIARWIAAGAPGCAAPGQDTTAPSFAGATQATPLAQAVRLSWDAATDDVTPAAEIVYLVFQAGQAGAHDFATPALETAPGATQATVTGLGLATEHFFVVRARDTSGNVDANTTEVSATTLAEADGTPPSFAGVASATPVGSTALALAWQPAMDDSSPGEAIVYHVYVSEISGGQDFGAPALTTPAGATGALVAGLGAATEHFFVVRAEDVAGNQDSNTIEVQGTTGDAVSFAADIQPLLTTACAVSGCHTGGARAEDLDLRSGMAHGDLVGVPASQCSDGRRRVDPGNPDDSYLIDKILGVDLCSGSIMPKGGRELTSAEIQIMRDWVAAGALED
jgi:hypothetical protein